MQLTRNALPKRASSASYICLSCRLRTQQQRRRVHDGASQEAEGSTGPGALEKTAPALPPTRDDLKTSTPYNYGESATPRCPEKAQNQRNDRPPLIRRIGFPPSVWHAAASSHVRDELEHTLQYLKRAGRVPPNSFRSVLDRLWLQDGPGSIVSDIRQQDMLNWCRRMRGQIEVDDTPAVMSDKLFGGRAPFSVWEFTSDPDVQGELEKTWLVLRDAGWARKGPKVSLNTLWIQDGMKTEDIRNKDIVDWCSKKRDEATSAVVGVFPTRQTFRTYRAKSFKVVGTADARADSIDSERLVEAAARTPGDTKAKTLLQGRVPRAVAGAAQKDRETVKRYEIDADLEEHVQESEAALRGPEDLGEGGLDQRLPIYQQNARIRERVELTDIHTPAERLHSLMERLRLLRNAPTELDSDAKRADFQRHVGGSAGVANAGQGATTPSPASSSLAWQHQPLASAGGRKAPGRPSARAYHTSCSQSQTAAPAAEPEAYEPAPFTFSTQHERSQDSPEQPRKAGIRHQLRQWQELHGDEEPRLVLDVQDDDSESANNLTSLSDPIADRRLAEEEEEERNAMSGYARAQLEDLDNVNQDKRYLEMGDLVELEFPQSERESLLGVFVRQVGLESQFFTKEGRWVHLAARDVQYSISRWISWKMIEPMIEHLPSEEDMTKELQHRAYLYDLSVPREISAPVVKRLVEFHNESLAIYRKHASTLDNAHNLLAHETNLRYGSLVSATRTLLNIPSPEELPLTALFTVRKALVHGGFGFNPDRRSHRLTGYLQIRSKEQVRMVEYVRSWLRDWQEDNARQAALSDRERTRHRASLGAEIVNGFLNKTRAIVAKSRTFRQPTTSGNIGPSNRRFPITKDSSCVRFEQEDGFTAQEQELIRFVEAWACMNMFTSLPRVQSLPPALLAATGLYDGYKLSPETGFMFLQEIGTLLPYENRVTFDPHLLLPSSQHSLPLQQLMISLHTMRHKPDLTDSMADLRHDWGNLPVFCIDDAAAHEIDDGISLQRIVGKDEYWVHVHIANPTAFFDRNHPLAKMARHMGESIYFPERPYLMLPRWATSKHFSLAKDRPCLTFSARMDGMGCMLEKKIQPGFIRNVLRLTPAETATLIGFEGNKDAQQESVWTVGGAPPPPVHERQGQAELVLPRHVEDLKTLQRLAEHRAALRSARGGLFFDSHRPEVRVWSHSRGPGLGRGLPHRRGPRIVHGDPVIQMRTTGFSNWFVTQGVEDILVREMMMLACEIGAGWCAARAIPTVYRGTVSAPNSGGAERYRADVVEPARQRNGGDMPTHIGIEYLRIIGATALSTTPLAHKVMGLPVYAKVTSPLRRYGDMLLHWQIESVLREEARTGTSLLTDAGVQAVDPRALAFLPFPSPMLRAIMLGLQPRESMLVHSSNYAERFWSLLLLFRGYEAGEAALPRRVHAYVYTRPLRPGIAASTMVRELGISATLTTGVEVRVGDWWECEVQEVNVFKRVLLLTPVRLVERWED